MNEERVIERLKIALKRFNLSEQEIKTVQGVLSHFGPGIIVRDMTQEDMTELRTGDMVRHKLSGNAYTIIYETGKSFVAVRTVTITHPHEWLVVK